eukprot:PhM_4_TR2114/c2_g2_i3/m.57598
MGCASSSPSSSSSPQHQKQQQQNEQHVSSSKKEQSIETDAPPVGPDIPGYYSTASEDDTHTHPTAAMNRNRNRDAHHNPLRIPSPASSTLTDDDSRWTQISQQQMERENSNSNNNNSNSASNSHSHIINSTRNSNSNAKNINHSSRSSSSGQVPPPHPPLRSVNSSSTFGGSTTAAAAVFSMDMTDSIDPAMIPQPHRRQPPPPHASPTQPMRPSGPEPESLPRLSSMSKTNTAVQLIDSPRSAASASVPTPLHLPLSEQPAVHVGTMRRRSTKSSEGGNSVCSFDRTRMARTSSLENGGVLEAIPTLPHISSHAVNNITSSSTNPHPLGPPPPQPQPHPPARTVSNASVSTSRTANSVVPPESLGSRLDKCSEGMGDEMQDDDRQEQQQHEPDHDPLENTYGTRADPFVRKSTIGAGTDIESITLAPSGHRSSAASGATTASVERSPLLDELDDGDIEFLGNHTISSMVGLMIAVPSENGDLVAPAMHVNSDPDVQPVRSRASSPSNCSEIVDNANQSAEGIASLENRPVRQTRTVVRGYDVDGSKMLNEYVVVQSIGEGAFAKVKLVMHEKTERPFAMKIMNKTRLSKRVRGKGNELEYAMREIEIMTHLHHPNLVRLHEVMNSEDCEKLYLILEYIPNGPVCSTPREVYDSPECPYDASEMRALPVLRKYIVGMLDALCYLHNKQVQHRDIKPENVLLDEHDECRLADFGVSSVLDKEGDLVATRDGTPLFFAPEMLAGDPYHGKPCDVWALGITCYILAFNRIPFPTTTIATLMRAIDERDVCCPPCAPQLLGDLLYRMMCKEPSMRITAYEARRHPFLTERVPLSLSVRVWKENKIGQFESKDQIVQQGIVLRDNTASGGGSARRQSIVNANAIAARFERAQCKRLSVDAAMTSPISPRDGSSASLSPRSPLLLSRRRSSAMSGTSEIIGSDDEAPFMDEWVGVVHPPPAMAMMDRCSSDYTTNDGCLSPNGSATRSVPSPCCALAMSPSFGRRRTRSILNTFYDGSAVEGYGATNHNLFLRSHTSAFPPPPPVVTDDLL